MFHVPGFVDALFYFAGAVLVWTIYFLKMTHYRNSVLYTALLLSEFHSKRYANFLSFDENLRNLHIG